MFQKYRNFYQKFFEKNGFNQNQAFSLVEAMVATMIMGIAFAGVYTMVAFSESNLQSSADRQKLQLIANQMLEIIRSNKENIDDYDNMDFTSCNPPAQDQTEDYHDHRYKWCRMINDNFGSAADGQTREILISDVSVQQDYVDPTNIPKKVEITLEVRGNASVTVQKMFN